LTLLSVEIPMQLVSTANQRLHWSAKARQTKNQRAATKLVMRSSAVRPRAYEVAGVLALGGQLVVTLTRLATRKLDSDNLAIAFKAVRDQIAEELGVDDGSDAIDWRYLQAKGLKAIRIEISRAAERAAAVSACASGSTGPRSER
jgi:hypothetical protein